MMLNKDCLQIVMEFMPEPELIFAESKLRAMYERWAQDQPLLQSSLNWIDGGSHTQLYFVEDDMSIFLCDHKNIDAFNDWRAIEPHQVVDIWDPDMLYEYACTLVQYVNERRRKTEYKKNLDFTTGALQTVAKPDEGQWKLSSAQSDEITWMPTLHWVLQLDRQPLITDCFARK